MPVLPLAHLSHHAKRKCQRKSVLSLHFSPKHARRTKSSILTASVSKSRAGMTTTRPCTTLLYRAKFPMERWIQVSAHPLKSLPHSILACDEHYELGPLTRSSLLLTLNLVIAKVDGANGTIC